MLFGSAGREYLVIIFRPMFNPPLTGLVSPPFHSLGESTRSRLHGTAYVVNTARSATLLHVAVIRRKWAFHEFTCALFAAASRA